MAKRRYIQNDNNGNEDANGVNTRRVVSVNQKMICHVFESDEVSRNVLFLIERIIRVLLEIIILLFVSLKDLPLLHFVFLLKDLNNFLCPTFLIVKISLC